MSPPPDLDGDFSPRYSERRRELEAIKSVTSAAEAGRAFAVAGDLLRRSDSLGDASRDVSAVLAKIEPKMIASYVESIDAAAAHTKLSRALDEAFEAIVEDGEERVLYIQSAETALLERDALASVHAAMTHASIATNALDEKLAQIDRKLSKRARSLIALNATRRREAASLNPSERASAWWFSARVGCDFLVSLYRLQEENVDVTQKHNAAHLATCEECQRDVEAASLAYTPEHIAASSLWRREHDMATAAEIAFMDAHAKDCKDCRRSLDALAQPADDRDA